MYVDLKLFRLKHNNMYQRELGEILGIEQSVLSRMEKQFAELNEVQYKKLCERFGEEEVQKYVKTNPIKDIICNKMAMRKNRESVQPQTFQSNETKNMDNDALIKSLYKTIENQAETIKILTQTIAQMAVR